MKRRQFIVSAALFGTTYLLSSKGFAMFGSKKENKFPFQLNTNEWKKRLTKQQYSILRDHATERSGSSSLDKNYNKGVYHCAGCDQKLFSSEHKFDSGTGWPSFYQPLDGVKSTLVGSREDNKLWMKRTEVHCTNCGGHQGHVFSDGPKPTGLRYCINGVAMIFKRAV
jgi:peptide-methionine (R)-S-oxide reductase